MLSWATAWFNLWKKWILIVIYNQSWFQKYGNWHCFWVLEFYRTCHIYKNIHFYFKATSAYPSSRQYTGHKRKYKYKFIWLKTFGICYKINIKMKLLMHFGNFYLAVLRLSESSHVVGQSVRGEFEKIWGVGSCRFGLQIILICSRWISETHSPSPSPQQANMQFFHIHFYFLGTFAWEVCISCHRRLPPFCHASLYI